MFSPQIGLTSETMTAPLSSSSSSSMSKSPSSPSKTSQILPEATSKVLSSTPDKEENNRMDENKEKLHESYSTPFNSTSYTTRLAQLKELEERQARLQELCEAALQENNIMTSSSNQNKWNKTQLAPPMEEKIHASPPPPPPPPSSLSSSTVAQIVAQKQTFIPSKPYTVMPPPSKDDTTLHEDLLTGEVQSFRDAASYTRLSSINSDQSIEDRPQERYSLPSSSSLQSPYFTPVNNNNNNNIFTSLHTKNNNYFTHDTNNSRKINTDDNWSKLIFTEPPPPPSQEMSRANPALSKPYHRSIPAPSLESNKSFNKFNDMEGKLHNLRSRWTRNLHPPVAFSQQAQLFANSSTHPSKVLAPPTPETHNLNNITPLDTPIPVSNFDFINNVKNSNKGTISYNNNRTRVQARPSISENVINKWRAPHYAAHARMSRSASSIASSVSTMDNLSSVSHTYSPKHIRETLSGMVNTPYPTPSNKHFTNNSYAENNNNNKDNKNILHDESKRKENSHYRVAPISPSANEAKTLTSPFFSVPAPTRSPLQPPRASLESNVPFVRDKRLRSYSVPHMRTLRERYKPRKLPQQKVSHEQSQELNKLKHNLVSPSVPAAVRSKWNRIASPERDVVSPFRHSLEDSLPSSHSRENERFSKLPASHHLSQRPTKIVSPPEQEQSQEEEYLKERSKHEDHSSNALDAVRELRNELNRNMLQARYSDHLPSNAHTMTRMPAQNNVNYNRIHPLTQQHQSFPTNKSESHKPHLQQTTSDLITSHTPSVASYRSHRSKTEASSTLPNEQQIKKKHNVCNHDEGRKHKSHYANVWSTNNEQSKETSPESLATIATTTSSSEQQEQSSEESYLDREAKNRKKKEAETNENRYYSSKLPPPQQQQQKQKQKKHRSSSFPSLTHHNDYNNKDNAKREKMRDSNLNNKNNNKKRKYRKESKCKITNANKNRNGRNDKHSVGKPDNRHKHKVHPYRNLDAFIFDEVEEREVVASSSSSTSSSKLSPPSESQQHESKPYSSSSSPSSTSSLTENTSSNLSTSTMSNEHSSNRNLRKSKPHSQRVDERRQNRKNNNSNNRTSSARHQKDEMTRDNTDKRTHIVNDTSPHYTDAQAVTAKVETLARHLAKSITEKKKLNDNIRDLEEDLEERNDEIARLHRIIGNHSSKLENRSALLKELEAKEDEVTLYELKLKRLQRLLAEKLKSEKHHPRVLEEEEQEQEQEQEQESECEEEEDKVQSHKQRSKLKSSNSSVNNITRNAKRTGELQTPHNFKNKQNVSFIRNELGTDNEPNYAIDVITSITKAQRKAEEEKSQLALELTAAMEQICVLDGKLTEMERSAAATRLREVQSQFKHSHNNNDSVIEKGSSKQHNMLRKKLKRKTMPGKQEQNEKAVRESLDCNNAEMLNTAEENERRRSVMTIHVEDKREPWKQTVANHAPSQPLVSHTSTTTTTTTPLSSPYLSASSCALPTKLEQQITVKDKEEQEEEEYQELEQIENQNNKLVKSLIESNEQAIREGVMQETRFRNQLRRYEHVVSTLHNSLQNCLANLEVQDDAMSCLEHVNAHLRSKSVEQTEQLSSIKAEAACVSTSIVTSRNEAEEILSLAEKVSNENNNNSNNNYDNIATEHNISYHSNTSHQSHLDPRLQRDNEIVSKLAPVTAQFVHKAMHDFALLAKFLRDLREMNVDSNSNNSNDSISMDDNDNNNLHNKEQRAEKHTYERNKLRAQLLKEIGKRVKESEEVLEQLESATRYSNNENAHRNTIAKQEGDNVAVDDVHRALFDDNTTTPECVEPKDTANYPNNHQKLILEEEEEEEEKEEEKEEEEQLLEQQLSMPDHFDADIDDVPASPYPAIAVSALRVKVTTESEQGQEEYENDDEVDPTLPSPLPPPPPLPSQPRLSIQRSPSSNDEVKEIGKVNNKSYKGVNSGKEKNAEKALHVNAGTHSHEYSLHERVTHGYLSAGNADNETLKADNLPHSTKEEVRLLPVICQDYHDQAYLLSPNNHTDNEMSCNELFHDDNNNNHHPHHHEETNVHQRAKESISPSPTRPELEHYLKPVPIIRVQSAEPLAVNNMCESLMREDKSVELPLLDGHQERQRCEEQEQEEEEEEQLLEEKEQHYKIDTCANVNQKNKVFKNNAVAISPILSPPPPPPPPSLPSTAATEQQEQQKEEAKTEVGKKCLDATVIDRGTSTTLHASEQEKAIVKTKRYEHFASQIYHTQINAHDMEEASKENSKVILPMKRSLTRKREEEEEESLLLEQPETINEHATVTITTCELNDDNVDDRANETKAFIEPHYTEHVNVSRSNSNHDSKESHYTNKSDSFVIHDSDINTTNSNNTNNNNNMMHRAVNHNVFTDNISVSSPTVTENNSYSFNNNHPRESLCHNNVCTAHQGKKDIRVEKGLEHEQEKAVTDNDNDNDNVDEIERGNVDHLEHHRNNEYENSTDKQTKMQQELENNARKSKSLEDEIKQKKKEYYTSLPNEHNANTDFVMSGIDAIAATTDDANDAVKLEQMSKQSTLPITQEKQFSFSSSASSSFLSSAAKEHHNDSEDNDHDHIDDANDNLLSSRHDSLNWDIGNAHDREHHECSRKSDSSSFTWRTTNTNTQNESDIIASVAHSTLAPCQTFMKTPSIHDMTDVPEAITNIAVLVAANGHNVHDNHLNDKQVDTKITAHEKNDNNKNSNNKPLYCVGDDHLHQFDKHNYEEEQEEEKEEEEQTAPLQSESITIAECHNSTSTDPVSVTVSASSTSIQENTNQIKQDECNKSNESHKIANHDRSIKEQSSIEPRHGKDRGNDSASSNSNNNNNDNDNDSNNSMTESTHLVTEVIPSANEADLSPHRTSERNKMNRTFEHLPRNDSLERCESSPLPSDAAPRPEPPISPTLSSSATQLEHHPHHHVLQEHSPLSHKRKVTSEEPEPDNEEKLCKPQTVTHKEKKESNTTITATAVNVNNDNYENNAEDNDNNNNNNNNKELENVKGNALTDKTGKPTLKNFKESEKAQVSPTHKESKTITQEKSPSSRASSFARASSANSLSSNKVTYRENKAAMMRREMNEAKGKTTTPRVMLQTHKPRLLFTRNNTTPVMEVAKPVATIHTADAQTVHTRLGSLRDTTSKTAQTNEAKLLERNKTDEVILGKKKEKLQGKSDKEVDNEAQITKSPLSSEVTPIKKQLENPVSSHVGTTPGSEHKDEVNECSPEPNMQTNNLSTPRAYSTSSQHSRLLTPLMMVTVSPDKTNNIMHPYTIVSSSPEHLRSSDNINIINNKNNNNCGDECLNDYNDINSVNSNSQCKRYKTNSLRSSKYSRLSSLRSCEIPEYVYARRSVSKQTRSNAPSISSYSESEQRQESTSQAATHHLVDHNKTEEMSKTNNNTNTSTTKNKHNSKNYEETALFKTEGNNNVKEEEQQSKENVPVKPVVRVPAIEESKPLSLTAKTSARFARTSSSSSQSSLKSPSLSPERLLVEKSTKSHNQNLELSPSPSHPCHHHTHIKLPSSVQSTSHSAHEPPSPKRTTATYVDFIIDANTPQPQPLQERKSTTQSSTATPAQHVCTVDRRSSSKCKNSMSSNNNRSSTSEEQMERSVENSPLNTYNTITISPLTTSPSISPMRRSISAQRTPITNANVDVTNVLSLQDDHFKQGHSSPLPHTPSRATQTLSRGKRRKGSKPHDTTTTTNNNNNNNNNNISNTVSVPDTTSASLRNSLSPQSPATFARKTEVEKILQRLRAKRVDSARKRQQHENRETSKQA